MIATPDRRVRVFVSSTLEELAIERTAARKAIETLRLTPVMFEVGARAHPPQALYRAYLEQSDVFVGIYGERYGWVGPGMTISGLEDEYRLAEGKPRLLYVKQDAPGREPGLERLLDAIRSDAAVSYRKFRDTAELRRLIEDDLAVLLSERFQQEAREEVRPTWTNLPAPLDRFVGREHELAALERLVAEPANRLVTVTGPGGVGKTRLALEAARRSRGAFSDGVHFTALAGVAEPELVPSTIQTSLDLPGASGSSPVDAVVAGLRARELLLVLDNFEHVLPAATVIGVLLEECPRVQVVVTSRAVLGLKGEHEYRVPPLSLPLADAELPDRSDAVALFVERAHAANASFSLDARNGVPVAEICRRLDGLPLAIELAAAHVRLLPPAAILDRLGTRLDLAVGERRGYPERQRTLRAAIDWSFERLDDAEQALFARASVFRGGWTLDALEAVSTGSTPGDVLALLASLVENSLVVHAPAGGEPRFSMLETLREYAGEKLAERGDAEDARAHHARFYLDLVESLGAELRKAAHETAMARVDREDANVRAAFAWAVEHGEAARVADAGWALAPHWTLRERSVEGRRWMRAAIETGEVPDLQRARALAVEGLLAFWWSDYAAAVPLLAEALGLFRALGDEAGISFAGFPLGLAHALVADRDAGFALLEDSRRITERLGNEWGVAFTSIGLAWALNVAERDAPLGLYEEAVARARGLGYAAETIALEALGRRHALRGEIAEAKQALAEALRRVVALEAPVGIGLCVDLLADLAAGEGEHRIAARLSAAAEAIAGGVGAPLPAFTGERGERLRGLREQLGDDVFEAESQAGASLAVAEAARQALAWAET